MNKLVAVNEMGRRVGETHHNSELSDHEVEQIRRLHEDGMSYPRIAEKFEISKSAVGKYCRYERRGQTPAFERSITKAVKPKVKKVYMDGCQLRLGDW